MTARALLDPVALLGSWDFTRRIVDRVAGEDTRVAGTTELVSETAGRVKWSEQGVMQWRDKEVPVTRVLFLELRDDGWFVTFDDGRDFHPWAPGEQVEHMCGADLYRGHVVAGHPLDSWTVEWNVQGPTKDYTMTTVLTRPTPTPSTKD
ncbi:MAG: hypothetical protein JWP10_248 [Nocardioidaceae bacterium]|nr:hypothetical protein [Nocardioidaceae bacterium]